MELLKQANVQAGWCIAKLILLTCRSSPSPSYGLGGQQAESRAVMSRVKSGQSWSPATSLPAPHQSQSPGPDREKPAWHVRSANSQALMKAKQNILDQHNMGKPSQLQGSLQAEAMPANPMQVGAAEPSARSAIVSTSPAAVAAPQESASEAQRSSHDVPEVSLRSSTSHDIIELQKQLQQLHSRQSQQHSFLNKPCDPSHESSDTGSREAAKMTASPVSRRDVDLETNAHAKSSLDHGV